MHKKFLAAVAITFIATFGLACGDDDEDAVILDDGVVEFDDFDFDDDGFISTAEWNDMIDTWDVDGDGVLDEDEFLMDDGSFDDFDGDSDAFVTSTEWDDAFAGMDLDDDGAIDDAEFF
jgi:hypothetical protein